MFREGDKLREKRQNILRVAREWNEQTIMVQSSC